jgi:hypothetical protein
MYYPSVVWKSWGFCNLIKTKSFFLVKEISTILHCWPGNRLIYLRVKSYNIIANGTPHINGATGYLKSKNKNWIRFQIKNYKFIPDYPHLWAMHK